MSKRVAEIVFKEWGDPPKVEIRGFPGQRIKVGQAVGVVLPPIEINNRKMPTLIVDLEVRRAEDEGRLQEFYVVVLANAEHYKDFWARRKREAENGIYLI